MTSNYAAGMRFRWKVWRSRRRVMRWCNETRQFIPSFNNLTIEILRREWTRWCKEMIENA